MRSGTCGQVSGSPVERGGSVRNIPLGRRGAGVVSEEMHVLANPVMYPLPGQVVHTVNE